MISNWTITFWTAHKDKNNIGTPLSLPILCLKRVDKKIKGEKGEINKKKYYGSKNEVMEKRGRILEVNIYYYEIYEWVN